MDKAYSLSPQRRAAYYIKAHNPRSLITPFGVLTFTRTIFVDKHDKSHFFTYIDHALGIPKYIQYDVCVRAMLIETYLMVNSLQKAGQIIGSRIHGFSCDTSRFASTIPKQTVAYIIHHLPEYHLPLSSYDEIPDTLYIMADEKYVPLQDERREDGKAKKCMIKVAVLFEGIHKLYGQYRLINPHYIIGHEVLFWQDVLDQTSALYDITKINHIVIMGDGAGWIKAGKGEMKTGKTCTSFLLDKFHTMQAVRHISIKYENALRYYIENDMLDDFKCMVKLIKEQYNEERCERMESKHLYIVRNWDAIQLMYHKSSFGCSMESHIQHILASKLTEVPRAFKRENLQRLVKLIAHYENHIDMIELYLKGLGKEEDGIVQFENLLDFSMFDKKPDTYDKTNAGKSIVKLLNQISSGKYH